jgi:hypothetical protein
LLGADVTGERCAPWLATGQRVRLALEAGPRAGRVLRAERFSARFDDGATIAFWLCLCEIDGERRARWVALERVEPA